MISIHDVTKQKIKAASFLAVGWDRKLHIWQDPASIENTPGEEEEDDAINCIDLPPYGSPDVHKHDIMSCTFDLKNLLIFTGGVDGTIFGWNYETKFARYDMHNWDETCTSENFIADSKSVDALVIMETKRLLISMSADQIIRFWDLEELAAHEQCLVFKFHANHINPIADEQLTGLAINVANDKIVTTDCSGRMKMFDVSRVEFKNPHLSFEKKEAQMSNPWYINAHRELISSVEIVEQRDDVYEEDDDEEDIELPEGLAPEERQPWPDQFILTASQDKDILLHRLSNGVKIGQFAQEEPWNIYDMAPYDKIRPNYYREWLRLKKRSWVDLIVNRLKEAHQKALSLKRSPR